MEKIKKTEVSELTKALGLLKKKAKSVQGDEKTDILKNIEMSENKLASLVAKENSDKIFNNFASFANTNGSFNPNGMWAVKKRVFLKIPQVCH